MQPMEVSQSLQKPNLTSPFSLLPLHSTISLMPISTISLGSPRMSSTRCPNGSSRTRRSNVDSSETAGAIQCPVTLGPNLALCEEPRGRSTDICSTTPTRHLNQAKLQRSYSSSHCSGDGSFLPANPEPKEAKPFAGMALQDVFASF